jgi:hypothetical protein
MLNGVTATEDTPSASVGYHCTCTCGQPQVSGWSVVVVAGGGAGGVVGHCVTVYVDGKRTLRNVSMLDVSLYINMPYAPQTERYLPCIHNVAHAAIGIWRYVGAPLFHHRALENAVPNC